MMVVRRGLFHDIVIYFELDDSVSNDARQTAVEMFVMTAGEALVSLIVK